MPMKPETNCNEIRYHLFPFLRNELAPADRSLVNAHLSHCKTCVEELDSMRRSLHALDALSSTLKTPEGAWKQLQRRVRTSQPVIPWRNRTEFRIAAGLIVFLGGLCLIWLLRINDQVLIALKGTFEALGIELPWLTEGPLSSFLAPLLFIILCSLLMLVLSPLVLKRTKAREVAPSLLFEEEKGKN